MSGKLRKLFLLKKPGKGKLDPKGYRPISLLPVIGKLYEKVVLQRLEWHTVKQQWTNTQQYGFQRGVGPEMCALNLTNKISSAFKNRKEISAVFCDISMAFQEVWHAALLKKMIDLKIPHVYLKFMRAFLINRNVTVQTDNENTLSKTLTQSCPQGSAISPWAWNIVLGDLFQEIKASKAEIQAFADEIVIYKEKTSKETSEQILRSALAILQNWANKWLVKFSQEKTKHMIFSRLRKPSTDTVQLDGKTLETVSQHKYLASPLIRNCLGDTTSNL